MIVRFDGKEVKDSRDLPRIVASTPVGKAVDVAIVRKGKEETKQVTLGRLEDGEKQQQAACSSLRRKRPPRPARPSASTCPA